MTLVWLPTAIALSAMVFAGVAAAPGVFLGSLLLNLSIEPTLVVGAAVVAAGNTTAPLLAALLLTHRYQFRPQLDRLRDAFSFLTIGVAATGVVTATLGALVLCQVGRAPWRDFPAVWLTWIGGEAAGSLVLAPLLLTWCCAPDPVVAKRPSWGERVAMAVGVAAFSLAVVIYGNEVVALPYLIGLLMVWVLVRAGLRGSSLVVAVTTFVMVAATVFGAGPFAGRSTRAEMLSLWVTLVALGGANVVAAALLAERDRAMHMQQRLLGELDHRVKNTLATVVALAERSSDDAVDVAQFRSRFIGRVRAIARTHEGLARSKWESMKVGDIVTMTLAPFAAGDAGKLVTRGDGSELAAAKVAPLTMVLHELATNAAKYGAWSRNGGGVTVTWGRDESGNVNVVWREAGGPRLPERPVPGYGLRLIEGIVSHQLGGRPVLDFREDGLTCSFRISSD